MDDEIKVIPLAAHEAAMSRKNKLLKWLIISYTAIVLLLIGAIYSIAISTEIETETTATETTTTTVDQDSGDGGENTYAGGDVIGEANYYHANN